MQIGLNSFEKIKQFLWIILAGVILISGLIFFYSELAGKITNTVFLVTGEISYDFPVQIDHMHPFTANNKQPSSGNPRMVIPEHWIDLGVISKGESGRVTFLIKNDGETNLVIEGATTTCSCLSAELSSVIIPPGKSSQVRVDYSFDHQEQQSQMIRRGLVFLTNDPQFPQAEVWLQAEMK